MPFLGQDFNFSDNEPVRTTLCNLHPDALHWFSVQSLPIEGGIWSKAVKLKVQTNESGKFTFYAFKGSTFKYILRNIKFTNESF